jgi:hydrogenase expression/formation protein HypC
MCVAVPTKVVRVEDDTAVVDVSGARRDVSLLLLDEKVNVGDYVLVHAGFAIRKIDEDYAKETLELFNKMFGTQERLD